MGGSSKLFISFSKLHFEIWIQESNFKLSLNDDYLARGLKTSYLFPGDNRVLQQLFNDGRKQGLPYVICAFKGHKLSKWQQQSKIGDF